MQVGGGRGEAGAIAVLCQQPHIAGQVLAHAAGVLPPALVQPVACALEGLTAEVLAAREGFVSGSAQGQRMLIIG